MDVLVTSLKCQVASLETQLLCANQEKQKLHDTVVCLSKILSNCNQDTKPPQTVAKSTQDIAEQILEVPNLIDLAIPTTNIPNPSASKLGFIATKALEREANPTDTRTADDLSNATAAYSSFGPVTTRPRASSGDKPPILDLNFRGLRTTLDGSAPKKPMTLLNPIESRSSDQRLSFDEIVGKIPTHDQHQPVHTRTCQVINTIPRSPHDKIRTYQNFEGKLNTCGTNNVPTSTYHFAAKTLVPSYESSSAQSSNYFNAPLSHSHGIRFQPKEGEIATRSRVMVLNLPKGISVSDLLSRIRGGTIISCNLLDTVFAYGGPSAMIRFSNHSEAVFCVDHAATVPLIFEGKRALVQLIPTPTYPLSPGVHQNIFEHGHTRCLHVTDFGRLKHSYVFKKYTDPQQIEYQATNGKGDWFVRFTSLERASTLWMDLQYFRVVNFRGWFMPDPCDIEESIDLDAWKAKSVQVMEGGVPEWKI